MIETPLIIQLANNRPTAAIAQLAAIIDQDGHADGDSVVDAHTEFHISLARLSGNQTMQIVSEVLYHIVEKANRSLQPTKGQRADRAHHRAAKTHAMVLDMIKAGEAEKAAELWNRHLKKGEEYVLSGVELSTVVDLLE